MSIENLIVSNLLYNEEFVRKTIPFYQKRYFSDKSNQIIFENVEAYIQAYNTLPTIEALKIDISNRKDLNDSLFKETIEKLDNYKPDENTNQQWLLDQTETFCRDAAIYNSILDSMAILDGRDKTHDKGMIPKLLSDALGVSFDTSVGHDFIEDAEKRYEFYHKKEKKIPFDIDLLNEVFQGGVSEKTLTIFLAGPGVGKSFVMCHAAATNLIEGKNVLYITLEMSEEMISKRIDANSLNIDIKEIEHLPKALYMEKIEKLRKRNIGKLIVKEYPTATAGSANFRYLINELAQKKKFRPDIIYVDYLGICASSRIKMSMGVNSYTYMKAVAEELRGLATEFSVPVVTAAQVNRAGVGSLDLDLTNTAESMALTHTADWMLGIMTDETMENMKQILFKQLKNRYGPLFPNNRFIVGVDRAKMRLYNVEQSAQGSIHQEDKSIMDTTTFGERLENDEKIMGKKDKLKGFK